MEIVVVNGNFGLICFIQHRIQYIYISGGRGHTVA